MNPREIARKLAEESIVLLKNDGVLPLAEGARIAVFGRAQEEFAFSGNGSGAVHTDSGLSTLAACEAAGLQPEPALAAFYREQVRLGVGTHKPMDWTTLGDYPNSGLMYDLFGQYIPPNEEYRLTETQYAQARAWADTALVILGRRSGGEECDRRLENDYYLSENERTLVDEVCARFDKVVLILTVIGAVDLGWTEEKPQIGAILFAGIFGEHGAGALARILTGRVNPSGRLGFTMARRYEDYPSAAHFSCNREDPDHVLDYAAYGLSAAENGSAGFAKSPVTVYQEDVYPGYRYFDAFGVSPLYAFGSGLSYSDFEWRLAAVSHDDAELVLTAEVRNLSSLPGKTVLQAYASAPALPRYPKRLVGFEKTALLEQGKPGTLTLRIPWQELAAYDEADAAYSVSAGTYLIELGESFGAIAPVLKIRVPQTLLVEQCTNALGILPCNRDKLSFLEAPADGRRLPEDVAEITLTEIAPAVHRQEETADFPEALGLSDLELACLCVGYGSGIPFEAYLDYKCPETAYYEDGTPVTVNDHPTGFKGNLSPAMPKVGLRSLFYKDGPAGVGEIAWPTEMLVACAFNRALWADFGRCVARECERGQVDVWLAPALNLHRNPLLGRCFEYFSEDPFLTGSAAIAIARGVQEDGRVLVCPKHFAANEQETFRRGKARTHTDAVDSIVTEKALRELYLKPFKMLVEAGGIRCLMTSFNKINGTFAAGSEDLCTRILRGEWGYSGAVVSDWGDMDTAVNGADALHAGNDIVMPGGPPVIAQIMAGLEKGTVTREDLLRSVRRLRLMQNSIRK